MSDKNLKDIKDTITDAGRALLAHSKTETVCLPLEGKLHVAIGTLAGIASVAGKSMDAPAAAGIEGLVRYTDEQIASAPSTNRSFYLAADVERLLGAHAPAVAKLTDERIDELCKPWVGLGGVENQYAFARAIEREVLGARAGVVAESKVERDGWLIDGSLIYRLSDKGVNCDEINVTMVNGSRAPAACHDAAVELLAELTAVPAAQAPVQNDEEVRRAAFAEAAKACAGERVEAEVTKTPGDVAYNMAINHCIEAIQALMIEAPAASKEAAAAEVPSKWISVAERLPEDGAHVIILCPDPEPGMWAAHWKAGMQMFESNTNGWAAKSEVSHWMPLPAPPTQQQSAGGED